MGRVVEIRNGRNKPKYQRLQQRPPSNLSAMHFLENYGYLPEMNDNELNLISHERVVKAIKLMQKYANLPQTGEIDDRTMAAMKSPRCGVPDVEDGQQDTFNRQKKQQKSSKYRSLKKRFAVYGPKWEKSPITWNLIHPSQTVSVGEARRVFKRAFEIWAEASDKLQFRESSDSNADILIGFYAGDHGDGQRRKFDGPGAKLAHAYAPPNGDVHFDDEEKWKDKDGPSLFWTAIHEFGHALGFAHTADESSIMFPYYQNHGDDFKLPDVDKAGVEYLYGNMRKTQQNESNRRPAVTESNNRNKPSGTSKAPAISSNKNIVNTVMCNSNIDAIASIRNEIFVFKDKTFWWVKNDLSLIRNEAIPIRKYFIGFPSDINRVDAVYERRSDRLIMFFVGKNYYLFNSNQIQAGPIPLTDLGLPRHIQRIDTIFDWAVNGRAYIFVGSKYWRMNSQETSVETDYPRDINVWKGVPKNVDAAFTWKFDSRTYFFKDQFYWKFDNQKMSVQSSKPEKIRDFLFRSINCRSAKAG